METFHWRGGFGYVGVTVFEAVLAAVVVNEIHRAATAFAAAVSLSLALWWYGVPYARSRPDHRGCRRGLAA